MKRQSTPTGKRLPALIRASAVAALYVGLTLLFSELSFGPVQFRIAECLAVLPFFFPETVFGLFFGCVISNFFSPFILPLDILIGSTATFLAAFLTSRCRIKWLAPLPPVLCNALLVPLIFCFSASDGGARSFATYAFFALTVFCGEIVVCYGLGMPLLFAVQRLPGAACPTKQGGKHV